MAKLNKTRDFFNKADFPPRKSASDKEEGEVNRETSNSIVMKFISGLSHEELVKIGERIIKHIPIEETELFQKFLAFAIESGLEAKYEDELKGLSRQINELNEKLESIQGNIPKRDNNSIDKELQAYESKFLWKDYLSDHIEELNLVNELIPFLEGTSIEEETDLDKKFIITLICRHVVELNDILLTEYVDELDFVKELNSHLRSFLAEFIRIESPIRKPILNWIANKCNTVLKQYQLISPETYVKVEPAYHQVVGSSGSRIKAGLSYLIIREKNKQIVAKADVKTY